jgi:hypothetical protein
MNYGATFTGLQLGTATLTSCAISYDGSYITISSGATVYTLNNNSTGFSVALGNQAGYQNQANNAIAIGNYAGYQNQTANSIILNASGQGASGLGLNAVAQGFYVAPIASYTASSAQSFALLGYGIGMAGDNQITQGIGSISTVLSNIFLGQNAGQSNTTGYANIYIGQNMGVLNTTGYQNVGIGQSTGYSITTAYNNTIVGANSGQALTTGYNNCFFGTAAGQYTTTGNLNTFLGVLAGGGNTTGSNNVYVGTGSGQGLTSGSNNVVIGTAAAFSYTTTSNEVVIGAGVTGQGVIFAVTGTMTRISRSSLNCVSDAYGGGIRIDSYSIAASSTVVIAFNTFGIFLLTYYPNPRGNGIQGGMAVVTNTGYVLAGSQLLSTTGFLTAFTINTPVNQITITTPATYACILTALQIG